MGRRGGARGRGNTYLMEMLESAAPNSLEDTMKLCGCCNMICILRHTLTLILKAGYALCHSRSASVSVSVSGSV